MSGIEEALNNMFPTGWLDPYGSMPLNKDYSVQIDITQVETDDGIKVTAVKTPPHAPTTSIKDAISMALGMGCDVCEAPTDSPQSADQGKRDTSSNSDKKNNFDSNDKKQGENGIMKSSSSGNSSDRDRNPGSQGSRPEPSRYGATEDEDAKKKPQD